MAQRNTYYQNEVIERKIDIKQFKRILRYILPYKKIFIIVMVLMLVSAVTSMCTPLLLKRIINHTVKTKSYQELLLIVFGMILLAGIEIAITYFHQTLMGKLGHNVIANIRKDVFLPSAEVTLRLF